MPSAWTIRVDGEWVAWLTFDQPGASVNTFTAETLAELAARLDELAADERIKAIAIRSGKPGCFIAGADVDELARLRGAGEAREKARAGLAVFAKLEHMPVPTVAVIHGTCLGGGLEMALACTYRLVTDDPRTSLGLPEVTLGIIPGWGGTQRLPRVVGLAAALPMILAGKPLDARRAERSGLADAVVAAEFHEEQTRRFIDGILSRRGSARALRRRRGKRRRAVRALEALPPGRWLMLGKAGREIARKTGDRYPAPWEALHVLRSTARRANAAVETEAFARLACSPVSRNLVWLFQASRRMKKAGGTSATRPIESAAVIGAGIMGGGIAWALANAGISVRLVDVHRDAAVAGLAAAARICRERVKRRQMTEGAMNLLLHRIAPTTDHAGFRRVDLVIEAVVEDLAVKQAVLRDIERRVSPDAIIATNTSSLPLRELALALSHPHRFVGLHFFNPVDRMQLVEVVPARRTARETVAAAAELVRRIGKLPAIVGDCPGFLVNRILLPYLVESAWMVEEGVAPQRIDGVLESFGMPMGPLALVDEVGIDTGYKVAKVLEGAYGPRMHVADLLGAVASAGELKGRKSGRGFYLYEKGQRRPNPQIERFVKPPRTPHQELADQEIVDRAILIMVNEAARCLDEGVAADPEQIDLAMVMGTGFAPFRGGPLHYADDLLADRVVRRLDELAMTFGERFEPVPLLRKLAKSGGRFHAESGRRDGAVRSDN
jgi:3-hydroxyacyl-CoA dehydrogenase/enoyl-CoA hydratase/3-hydroxybutyryl-CoA epimerase